jgi:putative endonuclease
VPNVDRRRDVGRSGEDRAVAYLKRQGYVILERNWRTSYGELDIVARQKQELVFVEVRTLETPHFGFPEESVGPGKQRQLARLASAYVQQAKHAGEWRIDVVAIDRDGLRHVQNAVSLW